MARKHEHAVIVIGSGFGGTMTALLVARALKRRPETVLMLERGTWWTTPVETVQDKQVKAYDFLREKGQPVQVWPSAEHFKGFLDIFTRCWRRARNEDGLYDLTNFGKRGLFGLSQNDGVTILRASGVGGGSLVYANVTIQPPDNVFDDERWPTSWGREERNGYFELAREAIGRGVLLALHQRDRDPGPPPPAPNTGLSNIVTRSPRLDPKFAVREDANNMRGIKHIDLAHSTDADDWNALWIDRARVFQTEIGKLTADFGTVDSSINDVDPEPRPFDPHGHPKNYCERQGRCIVGCLPGARHTLNKQLMAAIHGTPKGAAPILPNLHLEPLCEVDLIEALPDGGYAVHYLKRDARAPQRTTRRTVTAERVVVAAGTVGTSEIMLRSRAQEALPNLSEQTGFGFSTNGDWLAFLDGTRERVSLTRGPITTSFGHFNSPEAGDGTDPAKFHTIEDNGIPRAFSTLTGQGIPLLQAISKGRRTRLFTLVAIARYALAHFPRYVRALFANYRERQDEFRSEDEYTARMMCVAAMGREASVGRFRLGKRRDTTLRLERDDDKQFHEDPIYAEIEQTLARFAKRLTDDEDARFINPFVGEAAAALGSKSIGLSHPLGGCRMAKSAEEGVVDEHGRVFDRSKSASERPYYEGLYIADGACIPTALGVNPSLTISALALRTADTIIAELPPAAAGEQPTVGRTGPGA